MNNKIRPITIVIIFGVLFLLFTGSRMTYTLEPGERAVVFYKFTSGLDKEDVKEPGFHLIAPWNTYYRYEVKEQNAEETMNILDKNGLTINIDITVRFHPTYDKIGYLHEKFGLAYQQRLIIPEMRSAVRKVMGRYEAEEIYSTKRTEVEQAIISETEEVLATNYVSMKTLLIRAIKLPEKIRTAIDDKLKQEQEAAAYRYRLEKESSEAERKRIAAEGEATANKIVNSSLTPNLLKMRGIEATLELSKAPGSRTVIIGSGEDGLPLILGQ